MPRKRSGSNARNSATVLRAGTALSRARRKRSGRPVIVSMARRLEGPLPAGSNGRSGPSSPSALPPSSSVGPSCARSAFLARRSRISALWGADLREHQKPEAWALYSGSVRASLGEPPPGSRLPRRPCLGAERAEGQSALPIAGCARVPRSARSWRQLVPPASRTRRQSGSGLEPQALLHEARAAASNSAPAARPLSFLVARAPRVGRDESAVNVVVAPRPQPSILSSPSTRRKNVPRAAANAKPVYSWLEPSPTVAPATVSGPVCARVDNSPRAVQPTLDGPPPGATAPPVVRAHVSGERGGRHWQRTVSYAGALMPGRLPLALTFDDVLLVRGDPAPPSARARPRPCRPTRS